MQENNFKLPSLDAKIKFVPKRTKADTEVPPPDDTQHVTGVEPPPALPNVVSFKPPTKCPPPIPCPYGEPKWSAAPDASNEYHIEMLKSGQIVETVSNMEERPYWLIGKLPDNHIVMAHPTISRFHAVLQYRPQIEKKREDQSEPDDTDDRAKSVAEIQSGWYLYDLASTHGSFVNKQKIPSKTYVRVRVGYMMTFGGSTRRLILQGPEADAEPESALTITEMKEQKRLQAEAVVEAAKVEAERKEAEGATWGMAEDADEETDLSINPYASTNNEELYLQDPKKTLRGYFEREGLDLDYKVDELAVASFVCKIELPICDANGRGLIAEVSHKGKKKDCVLQAAMEACRMLDRHGVLRQAHHESRKRKVEHSDSDGDDEFFDRTGEVERKRIEKEAVQQTQALSHDELLQQEVELLQKLADTEAKIETTQQLERQRKAREAAEDDLDDFMSKMSRDKFDKTDIRRLRVEAINLQKDHVKLQRLIKIARPNDMPALVAQSTGESILTEVVEVTEKKKLVLPLFGKRGTFKFGNAAAPKASHTVVADDVGEEHDEDESPSPNVADPIETIAESSANMAEDVSMVQDHQADDTSRRIPTRDTDKHPLSTHPKRSDKPTPIAVDAEDESAGTLSAESSKKKRSRPRQRGERCRENVDYDDATELVSSEKYSTWVPPQNQSGDGSTTLNDKYGY